MLRGLPLSPTVSYLRDIVVTAAQDTIPSTAFNRMVIFGREPNPLPPSLDCSNDSEIVSLYIMTTNSHVSCVEVSLNVLSPYYTLTPTFYLSYYIVTVHL
jgi:hypothetical protein